MSEPGVAILVVEDNPGDARLIKEYLEEYGRGSFKLDNAGTLKDALRRPPGAFQAVLVDMDLPDSRGLPNVAAVSRHFTDAAIAVLTGRNEASLAAAAVRSGAQDYIVKGELDGPAFVGAVRRVIDLKRSTEIDRLRSRDKLQKEFVANVSHEFRTPIAAIKGAAETLQGGGLDAKRSADFLDIIVRHTERLNKLVEAVLFMSQIDAAQSDPHMETVQLRPLADRVLSGLAELADKRGVGLSMDVPASIKVRADPSQLERVLESLCANAIEYNKDGGGASVSARAEGHDAVVTVQDTGMGIPAEDLPHLFEKFHRTAAARARKLGGTGLGLMIVKRLVELHGGRVWAESVEGQGSTFRFTLPLA